MEIIEKKLNEIKPYENNPRKNDKAVEAVANSIAEFGFKVPIVIDKDGVIVAGHTRYKAARKLGLKTIPCVIADDLSEEQIKAFRLADNKVGELAGWDFEMLDMELIGVDGIDMEQFGFVEEIKDPAEAAYKTPHPYKYTHFLVTFDVDSDQIEDFVNYLEENEFEYEISSN